MRPTGFPVGLFVFVANVSELVAKRTFLPRKKTNPQPIGWGFGGKAPGDDLLSHGLSHTTIGAAAFHFRVRDGIGWFHSANFTRETVGASPSKKHGFRRLSRIVTCDVACIWYLPTNRWDQGNLRLYGQAARIISIS